MGSLKNFMLAGAATFVMIPGAFAADLAPLAPPMMPRVQAAPVDDCCNGWYLRGDIGVGVMRNVKWADQDNAAVGGSFIQQANADATMIGAGVGYQWNSWLRVDATAEIRGATEFKATDNLFNAFVFNPNGTTGSQQFNFFETKVSSLVFLANAYVDLGTWWCITPFVGAGVGFAGNTVAGLTDLGAFSSGAVGGFGFADEATKWNFAWAVHAGLAYNVSNNLKLELSYRYLNLGDATSGTLHCGNGCTSAPVEIKNIQSNDFRIGMRWLLNDTTPAPQPVYAPPLMRKG
jgi:opacity protein-like surface antigen